MEATHNADYVLQRFHDGMPLEAQVDLLAEFLIDYFGGPWRSMGAIEMAIRLLAGEERTDGE